MITGKESFDLGGRILNFGMVGGGAGSFIGDVHRKAAVFDGKARLVAGCFSQDFENTRATGKSLSLDSGRLYRSFVEMAEKEAGRNDPIDFVIIVTPNQNHYHSVKAFLEKGIHVVCDKPFTCTVAEAEELTVLSKAKDLLLCVTYTYSGYPIIKQAREMVRRGDLGEIRMVMGEYPQDWLATPVEKTGHKQALWRTDPSLAGRSCSVGDIGSHIEHTVSCITGLEIKSLCASLDVFGEDRKLDTNAGIMLKYTNGASGIYWCSQVAVGRENSLKIRVFGTKASLEWEHDNCNYLKVARLDQPPQFLSRGAGYLYPQSAVLSRVPPGHPEGYYEAFANLYQTFITALIKKQNGEPLSETDLDFPDAAAGLRGVKFINRCVDSSEQGGIWLMFER